MRRRFSSTPGDWVIVFSDGVSRGAQQGGRGVRRAAPHRRGRGQLDATPAGDARGDPRRRAAVHRRARRRATTSRRWSSATGASSRRACRGSLRRAALGVWRVFAVAVWNGIFDFLVSRGEREYLWAQARADAGQGPPVVLHDDDGRRRSPTRGRRGRVVGRRRRSSRASLLIVGRSRDARREAGAPREGRASGRARADSGPTSGQRPAGPSRDAQRRCPIGTKSRRGAPV